MSEKHPTIAELDARMLSDTIWLRAEFFRFAPVLTANEVAVLARLSIEDATRTVERWRTEAVVLAVKGRDADFLYPAFQFDSEMRPLPVMAEILAWFSKVESRSDWDNAFWFIGANGWLGGKPPCQMLKDEPAKVVKAAKQEVLPDVE